MYFACKILYFACQATAVGIRGDEILEIFIAESEDSDTIYTYGNEYDVVDMSVSELQDKMEKWEIRHT